MKTGWRRYAEYESPTDDWAVPAPSHWDVEPIGRMGRIFKARGGSKADAAEVGVPCIRYGELYTRHRYFVERATGFVDPDVASEYTPVAPGDVLIAASGETARDIGKSAVNLIEGAVCGGDLIVFRPGSKLVPRFLGYALDSVPAIEQKAQMARGFTVVHVYADQIKSLRIAVPPRPEQERIARFLDRAMPSIDELIARKQRFIDLLREERAAVITGAVTKGLDPKAPMRPSGVAWLGDVPAHWEVSALKRLAECLDGQRVPLNSVERAEMRGEYPYWGANSVVDHVDCWLFDEDIVLLGEDGAPFFDRLRPVAFHVQGRVWVNNHAHVLRPDPKVRPRFLSHVLNVVEYAAFIAGTTRDKLTQERMNYIPVQLPGVEEQAEIELHLSSELDRIAELVARAGDGIGLLKEYRSALITAAVTGQIDVREGLG